MLNGPESGGSSQSEASSSKPERRHSFYVGMKHSRKEKQPPTPDTGGPKTPDKNGGNIGDEGVNRIVSAIDSSAEKISGTIKDESKNIQTKLTELNQKLIIKMEEIWGLQEQLLKSNDPTAISESIDKLTDDLKVTIQDLTKAMDSVKALSVQEIKLLQDNQSLMQGTKSLMSAYLDQMESQIPEELKNPTPDRWDDPQNKWKGVKPAPKDAYKDKDYQNWVGEWFEDRLERMESFDQSFEEQGDVYRYMALYVNNFLLRPETKILGEKLRDKLETRRIAHRVARVWDIAGPEVILGEASRISYTTLSKIFKEGGSEAQGQLQNYERMGRILRERRDELLELLKARDGKKAETPQEKALEKEIKAKELYILDCYRLGGSEDDKGLDHAYVGSKKYNGEVGAKSNDNKNGYYYRLGKDFEYDEKERAKSVDSRLKNLDPNDPKAIELRKQIWAKKYAGKLWSISFRAAYHDILLNGTGDFYAARIMNFSDRLRNNVLMRDSEEIWNPKTGSFNNKPFDIGYVDIISEITKDIDEKDDLEKVGILTVGGKRDIKGSNLRTLENFEWCSEEIVKNGKKVQHAVLWDEALAKPETRPKEGVTAIRMTYFNDADNTRKKMWGADSFFHKPTSEGIVGMEGVFAHMGTGSGEYPVFDLNGKPMLDKNGKPVVIKDISKIESKWIEMLDRACSGYLRTPKAADWLGNPLTGYAEKATIREWIRTAVKNGTISSETQKILLEKNFGTSNKFLLDRMTEISVLWNDFKMNFGMMSWQAFMEFLKRAFGYVFTDELR